MTKSSWMAWGATATALVAAGWFFHQSARRQDRIDELERELANAPLAANPPAPSVRLPDTGSSVSAPLPPVEPPPLAPAGTTTGAEVSVTAYVAGPDEPTEPPEVPEAVIQAMNSFERAMDREFDRLEERESRAIPAVEQDVISELKEQMLRLDEIYAEADAARTDEERALLRTEMRSVMGRIISLGQTHRRQRLEEIAIGVGFQTGAEINAFVNEINQVYRETELDWASLFNRGP